MRARVALVVVTVLANAGASAHASGSGSARGSASGSGSARGSGSASGSGSATGSGSAIVDLPIDIAAPQLTASASPSEVRLGTAFTLFVTASYGANVVVNIVDPVDLGPALEVRRRFSNDHKRSDGQTVREWQFEVLPWELGDIAVPPIVVTYTIGGNGGQVATKPVPLRVVGTLGEVDDGKMMRPALPPKPILVRSWFWLYVVAGGVAGTAVFTLGLVFAIRVRRRRRAHTQRLTGGEIAWRDLNDADKFALAQLAAIEDSGVLHTDPTRGFAEMATVVREFGGGKFGFTAVDCTTREWLQKFGRRAPPALQHSFAAWFGPADLAKYAAVSMTASQAEVACRAARGLIIACAAPTAPAAAASDNDQGTTP